MSCAKSWNASVRRTSRTQRHTSSLSCPVSWNVAAPPSSRLSSNAVSSAELTPRRLLLHWNPLTAAHMVSRSPACFVSAMLDRTRLRRRHRPKQTKPSGKPHAEAPTGADAATARFEAGQAKFREGYAAWKLRQAEIAAAENSAGAALGATAAGSVPQRSPSGAYRVNGN